jgi:hypothetical protein
MMKKNGVVRTLGLLLLAVAALAAAGCLRPDIDEIHAGMMPSDVEHIMGEPLNVVLGDGVDLDKKTYVYPTGRIHFVNQLVVMVEKDGEARTLTEKFREGKNQDR